MPMHSDCGAYNSRAYLDFSDASAQYKYSCPRFCAHAAGEPRRFFMFLFPPRGKRGRRPVTSESKHVTLPKGIALTKKHDLAGGEYRDRL